MSTFWKIEERSSLGFFFTWDGIYETREGAEKVIAGEDAGNYARAVLYRTGGWIGGPVRVEDQS